MRQGASRQLPGLADSFAGAGRRIPTVKRFEDKFFTDEITSPSL